MPSTLPSLRDLLVQGGFRLRSATRADCARCQGRSRGTVSYNAEVAHCFRCNWSANQILLARELGLAPRWNRLQPVGFGARKKFKTTQEFKRTQKFKSTQAEACATTARNESSIRAFVLWREERLRQVSGQYWGLSRAAVRAGRALVSGALTSDEQELAWDALARFYHEEARLSAAFDLLMLTKAGAWLETDARIEDLFAMWREIVCPYAGRV